MMKESRSQEVHRMDARALASLFMLASFVLLVPSGMAMHSYAHEDARQLHHAAMAIHNSSALVFLLATAAHLALNWRSIVRHSLSKAKAWAPFRKEALVAVSLTLFLVLLAGSHAFHS